MEYVVKVEKITKRYTGKKNTTADQKAGVLQRYIPWMRQGRPGDQESVLALNEVCFELEQGDVLGIIGRNGAGKSTLLKVMAGIVKPSSGRITYKGKLNSILELGAGFHPDLTGRENIFFSGALMGISRSDLLMKFDSIVSFSEIESSLDMPVKHYSSGMYLRLAFSVFSHLRSDLLLLDEMIAVGDFPFRQKCYQRIRELADDGTTVILVSHHPEQINDLCNKCLWMDNGASKIFGDTTTVLSAYLDKYMIGIDQGDAIGAAGEAKNFYVQWPDGLCIHEEVSLSSFGLRACQRKPEDPISITDDISIEIVFDKLRDDDTIEITVAVRSLYEAWAMIDSYGLHEKFEQRVMQKARYTCTCTIPAGVINHGIYQLGCLISKNGVLIYQNPYILAFRIGFATRMGIRDNIAKAARSIIQPIGEWEVLQEPV